MADEIAFGGQPLSEEEQKQWEQKQSPPPPEPVDRIATDNVQNFIEENVYVPLVDTVDNLLGNKRSTEEIRSDRKDLNTKVEEKKAATAAAIEEAAYANPAATAATETIKAVAGGIEGFLEGSGEALEYVGDILGSPVAAARGDWKNVPWSNSYESADWEFGLIKENKTWQGNLGRNMISMVLQMRQLARLKIGVGGGQSAVSRLGSEALRGGIVDFFNHPGEANLSNLLETGIQNEDGSLMKYWNFLPAVGGKDLLKHPDLFFIEALKHKDEDNDLIRRIKNSVEGGPIGLGVDAVSEVFGAFRHSLRKAIEYQAKTGKPGGGKFIDEYANYIWHGTTGPSAKNIDKRGFRSSKGINALVGDGVYFTDSQSYASMYATERSTDGVLIGGDLPTDAKILDISDTRGIDFFKGIGIGEPTPTNVFGETFYYLSEDQKNSLREYVLNQGFDGIKFDPDFNAPPGEGASSLEVAIYNIDVANRLVGSRAGSINIENTPGMIEARKAEQIIEDEWTALARQGDWEDIKDVVALDEIPFEDRVNLRIDTQLSISGRPGDLSTNANAPTAIKVTPLLNGQTIQWTFVKSTFDDAIGTSTNVARLGTAKREIIDVSWTSDGELGKSGARRAMRAFPELIEGQLPPGTILSSHPSMDWEFSNMSEVQKRRIGQALYPGEKFISEAESIELAEAKWNPLAEGETTTFDYFRKDLEDTGEIPYTLERRLLADGRGFDESLLDDIDNLQDNVRARLYKQIGFSDPDAGGGQFGIVRATRTNNSKTGKIIDPLYSGLRADELDQRINAAINSEEIDSTKRPGYSKRKLDQDTQPRRGEDGATDPTERAGRTTEYSLDEAAISQETKVFDQTLVGGSNPSVNDATVAKLSRMSQPELIEYIKTRSPEISIDEIARSVSKQPEQYIQEALLGLARFATDGKIDHIEGLGTVWRDVHRFDQEGVAVLRILSNDVSEQMYDLAEYMLQLDGIDEPLRRASIQYLERAKVLMKLRKEASSDSGFGLLNWWVKKIPPDMHASIKKANVEIDEIFDKYLKVFENGDTVGMLEIRDDFLEFARGTVASQGDPTQVVSFFSSMMRVGIRNANQAVINAWLSSPVSQVRNIAGNAIVAAERPFATFAGHAMVGEWKEARAAFSMLDSLHISSFEALRVAKKSLFSDTPITEGNKLAEFTEFSSQTRRDIDNLHRVASNPAQKFAANILDWHYTLINLPWNTWPGRGLQSGDDFFKSLTAQMDLRYEAALAADGNMFKNKDAQNAEYKRLVLEKLGPNGEILDEALKYNAQEATFQLELEGKMQRIANSLNAHPEMKQFIPFVRTPHNINVFASQHIPLPFGEKFVPGFGREYDEIMKNGTASQKALVRGRKAVGGLLVTIGTAMAAGGMLTGNGPANPELRELWRRYNEPMSIKIGEDEDGNPIWQSYRSIPGADLIFSLIADAQFLYQYLPEAEAMKVSAQLTYTITQSITNRSTLAGFIELASLLDAESWTPRGMGRAIGNRANDLFPVFGGSGLRRQFENAQSAGIYEYRNTLEAIKGRMTAGILGDKVPVMDILTGEQMIRGTEGWGNFLNPFRTVHKNAHPVARRLGDLRYELNRGVVDYVKIGRQGREPLTIAEQQFIRKHTYNNGRLTKDLEDYLNSEKFKNYYQAWLDNRGTVNQKTRQESAWYTKINQLINFHRKQAVNKLLSDSTDPVALEFQNRVRQTNSTLVAPR